MIQVNIDVQIGHKDMAPTRRTLIIEKEVPAKDEVNRDWDEVSDYLVTLKAGYLIISEKVIQHRYADNVMRLIEKAAAAVKEDEKDGDSV